MGSEFETNVKLDHIQDFEMMFERMKVNRPREAAIYYATLVIDCPNEFSEFLKVAEELANITRRPLETGRASLLKYGLIAKVLFSNEADEDFGRESYLPVHPRAIWEDIKSDIKNLVAEDTYNAIENRLKNYGDCYTSNFEKYGIKLKRNGNVTLQYSGKWILYNVLNNCIEKSNHLKMQVGGERFFNEPFLKYFKKFLDLDTKIQLIIDAKANKETAKGLKKLYGDNLDIRYFSDDVSGTMRNFVFGKEMAVNGIKILHEPTGESSYIGTAYVKLEDIEILDDKFNSLWEMAKPLKLEKEKK
jgi:sugar-specific transcriptional regulator TrmB